MAELATPAAPSVPVDRARERTRSHSRRRLTIGRTSGGTLGGMADKVTLSLSPDTLSLARSEATREGLTLSAWMDRAARREANRDAGTRYRAWLAQNPDIAAEVNAWRAFASATLAERWSRLSDQDDQGKAA